jgi:hypothetical protein
MNKKILAAGCSFMKQRGDKHPNQQNNIKWGEYISDHYRKIYGE